MKNKSPKIAVKISPHTFLKDVENRGKIQRNIIQTYRVVGAISIVSIFSKIAEYFLRK